LAAFLLGLSTSALGPARQINLLSFPLLGLLAWNLAVYLVFFLIWILKGKAAGPPGKGLGSTVAPLVTLGYLRRAVRRIQAHEPETAGIVRRSLSSYLSAWRPISAPLVQARARRMFHVGAFAAMAGVLAGMYLRGLVFEYSVIWESTFLDEDGVRRLLGWARAPALAVLGRELPPLEGPAAPWIHLFGISAGLIVLLPRGLLAISESLRVARLKRRLPLALTGAYFRKVLSSGRGDRLKVRILPYSRELPRRQGEKLQTALLDLFGSRAILRLEETLEYGAEASKPGPEGSPEETDDSLETVSVLIFNLAQTPENEVHGELVESLTSPGGEAPLVVVDAASYRQRLGASDGAPQRLEERRKAWSRALASTEARVCHGDLEEASTDELLALLTASLERPSSEGAESS